MRNAETWRPSKYVLRGPRLCGARDTAEISVGSQLIADLNAEGYSRLLPRFAKGILLDLGCGKVPLYGVYQNYTSNVICADWPASLHGSNHVDVACDAGMILPFRDEVFDTVLASDVLEHIYDARGLIAEVARILRPGGHVIINTPFMYQLHECPHDYHRLTAFALERMFAEAGLEMRTYRALRRCHTRCCGCHGKVLGKIAVRWQAHGGDYPVLCIPGVETSS